MGSGRFNHYLSLTLIKQSMNNPFHSITPKISTRGIHLDLKGTPPTFPRLMCLLDHFSKLGFNLVLVEWEDCFPWQIHPSFRSPSAYTEEEIRQFVEKAAKLRLELVPLVQTFGHMENFLKGDEFLILRENPVSDSTINPLALEAASFVKSLILDVLRLMPSVRYFHLGGDETWAHGYPGTHPGVRTFLRDLGEEKLYLQHMEPFLDLLDERAIRPMLWHDMMAKWDLASLKSLALRADLVAWGYNGIPDSIPYDAIERFLEAGFTLWGSTAYKGADGPTADRPDLEQRGANGKAWVEIAQRHSFAGLITTGWSRYTYHSPQCESLEAAWDVILLHSILMDSGSCPDNVVPEAAHWLGCLLSREEGERFLRIREAATVYQTLQNELWDRLRICNVQWATARVSLARKEISTYSDPARKALERLNAAATAYRATLQGLVPDIWLDEYFSARSEPLRGLLRAEMQ
jgi:hexosaminidase